MSASRSKFPCSLLLITAVLIVAIGNPAGAVVTVSGFITNDTIWTANDIILVTGNVIVDSLASLQIEPGATIRFNPGLGLFTWGQLTAIGGIGQPIRFTSAADTVGGNPQPGDWAGIEVIYGADAALQYCDVDYATEAIRTYKSTATYSHCNVNHFSVQGFTLNGGLLADSLYPVSIDRCTVTQVDDGQLATGVGIYITCSVEAGISGSVIRNCGTGIHIYGCKNYPAQFQITNCLIENNLAYGIYSYSGG